MSAADPTQLVWLYDERGVQKIAVEGLLDATLDWQFNGSEELRFAMRVDDPKHAYLQPDQIVRWTDRLYRNVEMIDRRRGNRITTDIRCEALYYDLIGIIKVGNFALLGETPENGLISLLTNTGWSIGDVTTDTALYSIEGNDQSVLEHLKNWATVTGNELLFDSAALSVSLIPSVGQARPLAFRYGRNIRGLERRYSRPVATRLYPFGASDLNITGVNPTGQEFIENYDWYIDTLGLSLTEARNLYRKDNVWVDRRYLLAINLFDAAVERLAALAQPILSYDVDIADLSQPLGLTDTEYEPGDTVRVTDLEFGVDLNPRVVRKRMDILDPQRDKIELDFLRGGLSDAVQTSDQRTIDYGAVATIVDANVDPITVNATPRPFAEITLTVSGVTTPILGAVLTGLATGDGTLQVIATLDGVQIGGNLQTTFTNGERVELAFPTFVADIEEGTYTLDWRCQIVSGSGTIAVGLQEGRGWALVRGAVGIGFASTPNQTITESISEIVLDSASVSALVETQVPIGVSAGEEVTDVTLDELTDDVILPWTLDQGIFSRLDGPAKLGPPLPEEITGA